MVELRKAAEMALEALEGALSDDKPYIKKSVEAIGFLRQALAQPDWTTDTPVPPFKYLDFSEYKGTGNAVKIKHSINAQPEQEHFCDTHCVHTDHHPDCELAQDEQEPKNWFDDKEYIQNRFGDSAKVVSVKRGLPTGAFRQPQPEQEPVAWTQVSDALPKSGVPVLACYKNRLGNLRRIRACWVAAKTEEASLDYGECYEYDEETDEYYLPEGWYECMDNWPEYSSVAVCEGEVTHWIPLPLAPDEECTAPPSKPWVSLTDEEISTIDWKHNETLHDYARAIEAKLKEKNGY